MKSRFSILPILLIVTALVACGGGRPLQPAPTPNPAPTPKAASSIMSHTRLVGMHIHDVKQTTATNFSVIWGGLFPTVYAQSSITVAVSQNWEGVCNRSPQPGNTTSPFVSYAIFGLGQNNDATCLSSSNDADGTAAAQNSEGKLVYGAGTLSNLVVSTDRGTNITSVGGAPVKIWVTRNGAVQFTGLTCTVPAGANELVCQGTSTFAAQNLDRVIATVTKGDADVLINLTVNFTKSLP